jgi:hypothetical protein
METSANSFETSPKTRGRDRRRGKMIKRAEGKTPQTRSCSEVGRRNPAKFCTICRPTLANRVWRGVCAQMEAKDVSPEDISGSISDADVGSDVDSVSVVTA